MNDLLEKILKSEYSRKNFILLSNRIFENFDKREIDLSEEFLSSEERTKVESFTLLGTAKVSGKDLHVIEVELKSDVESSPVFQRNIVGKFLKRDFSNIALVAYYTKGDTQWKIAIVTASYKEKDKVKEISETRRYYYIVGNNEVHTPLENLSKLIDRDNTINDILDAFSIEKVTKEFFESVAELFYKLVGGSVERKGHTEKYYKLLKLPSVEDERKKRIFAIKLLSRLIFSWFLKKKGLISDEVLSSKAVLNYKNVVPIELRAYNSYYHSALEPLFFEVLNKKQSERDRILRNSPLFKDIPFLNGGIFEAKSDDDFYYKEKDDISKRPDLNLDITDSWFTELFELFERYNFTVDESTPIDIDISIDPEMLGRIFENLLAEINKDTQETARKSTGSYYTPRNIVDYMVSESLKYYFGNKTSLNSQEIDDLLSYGVESVSLSENKKKEVIEAIDNIKFIDPACGSGAFPMGVLQKLLLVLKKVDPNNKYWIEKKLSKIDDPVIRETEKERWLREFEETNYWRKLVLLRDSIYGVDIQPEATEISRLRAFLTLIVDKRVEKEKANAGIDPLPNLDFKFVTANSLIDPDKIRLPLKNMEGVLPNIKETTEYYNRFAQKVNNYFYESDHKEKQKLIEEIKRIIEEIVEDQTNQIKNITNTIDKRFEKKLAKVDAELKMKYAYEYSLWQSYLNFPSDKPVEFFNVKYFFPSAKDGFDIVIANPPYIRQERIKEQKPYLETQGYKVFSGTADLYVYFYERGYELLKDGGILTFISSNKWMRANYGEKLRKFLKENTLIKELIDFGGYRVFAATVDTNIIVFEKNKFDGNNEFFYLNIGDDFDGVHLAQYFNEKANVMSQKDLDDSAWTLAEDKVLALKEKIEKIGKPLKNWDVKIYRGILTGFNEAFIIDTKKKNEILANCKTDDERKRTEEIMKPILRGRDIGKYYYKWADLWLIKIESGWTNKNRGEEKPEEFFKKMYPSVHEHLVSFSGIKGKGRGLFDRDDQGDYWWELRDCDYYPEFEKEKIVWQRVTQTPKFMLIPQGYYCEATTHFITINDDSSYISRFLVGIFNSNLFKFAFYNFYMGGGIEGEIKGGFIGRFPIPPITPQNQPLVSQIESLVDQILEITRQPDYDPDSSTEATQKVKSLEEQIDRIVYQLYNLSEKEIKVIEGGR